MEEELFVPKQLSLDLDGEEVLNTGNKKPQKQLKKKHYVLEKVLLCLVTLALLASALVVGAGVILTRGPSRQAKILFVRTWNELGWNPEIPIRLLSEEEVTQILEKNVIADPETGRYPMEAGYEGETYLAGEEKNTSVEVTEIRNTYYNGYLVTIGDPAQLDLAVSGTELTPTAMNSLYEVMQLPAAVSTGSEKPNVVICNGQILADSDKPQAVVGMTGDHYLKVGIFTSAEAKEAGMTDAVSDVTILVENGQRRQYLGGGCLARIAVGQKADGTILIVSIHGIRERSLGMTHDELAQYMEELGCINAAEISGGERSALYLNGELSGESGIFSQSVPMLSCAWVVRGEA